MSVYKWLGEKDGNYYLAKIFVNEDTNTASTEAAMIYRFLTETKLITHVDQRLIVFEFFKHLDYVIAKIIKHTNSSYVVDDTKLDSELDILEGILNDYLLMGTCARTFSCIGDSKSNFTTMMEKTTDLTDIKEANAKRHVDYVITVSITVPLDTTK